MQAPKFPPRVAEAYGEFKIREKNISACATVYVRYLSVVGGESKLKAFIVDSPNATSEFSSAL